MPGFFWLDLFFGEKPLTSPAIFTAILRRVKQGYLDDARLSGQQIAPVSSTLLPTGAAHPGP